MDLNDDSSVSVVGPAFPSLDGAPWSSEAWWSGTRRPLREATGLHPDAYTSPAFFDDEQRRLFERAWVGIGLSREVPVGRIIARRIGRRSVIVTRDIDGELRGYINACRHRGTELIAGDCAISSTIRCPYHRWGYRLDGSLVAAPRFNEVPRQSFDPDDFALEKVRVAEWAGLVFGCVDPATPELEVWLGDLPERLAGYRLDEWEPFETQTVNIDANWKLITENYQEYYHLQWVHPELSKVSRVADHYRYQGPGMYCGQTTTPVSGDSRNDWLALPPAIALDESDVVSGRFVAIFPNIMLSVLPNHVFVMRLDPVGPGRTQEVCTWLLPQSTMATQSAELDAAFTPTREFWLEVNNEDIDICQRSQRGLTSAGLAPGPLSPRFEEPLHRFHNMVASHILGARLADEIPGGDDINQVGDRWGTAPNPNPPLVDH